MREGKEPLDEAELKTERSKLINKRHEEKIRDQVGRNRETSDKQLKNTERIVDLVRRSKESLEGDIKYKAEEARSHKKDQILFVVLITIYVVYLIYSYAFSAEAEPIMAADDDYSL